MNGDIAAFSLRATRGAYPFENGGENRPSKAYFTQWVADAVWESIPLTFNFINQFRATIIVKWDDYTLFELSDSANKKSYWTNENINKILTNGYELEVNKDIYLSHGMDLLDSWRNNKDMLIDIDRAHVIYSATSNPKYRSFSVWSNIKKDKFLENVETYGIRNSLTTIIPDTTPTQGRPRIWLNQKFKVSRRNACSLVFRISLFELYSTCTYYVFREVQTGRAICIPILNKTLNNVIDAFVDNETTATPLKNSRDYLIKEIVNNVKFINQFEGLFYGPNITQWTSGMSTSFNWLQADGTTTTITNILNISIEPNEGAGMTFLAPTGDNIPNVIAVEGIKRKGTFGRWIGHLNNGPNTAPYNMDFIYRTYFDIEAQTTYYKPTLNIAGTTFKYSQTNFIAWMTQFKNGINQDNILSNGYKILGESDFFVDFANGFIATRKIGVDANIETDSIETINGGLESSSIVYPNGLPSNADGYKKYISSVMDTMNTGYNQITQNEIFSQSQNIFSGLSGLAGAAANKDIFGAITGFGNSMFKIGGTALRASQARASMKAGYSDKTRTLQSNVYNGSVADMIFKNLHVPFYGPNFSYGQMATEYSDAGLIDINQRIFLYGNLVDSVEKMGTLFPRPYYNFISIKSGWLKHNLKQYFPNTNAALFGEILNDLSLGMRVCEAAPDWQTNPVHQVN